MQHSGVTVKDLILRVEGAIHEALIALGSLAKVHMEYGAACDDAFWDLW